MHLASATIYRFSGKSDNLFNQFYYIKKLFGQPNNFHLIFCGLKIFPSVEFANKVFYSLYVILLPLSSLLLIKKMGGNPWFSLFSFLVLYNSNTMWGFVGFTFSIPFVLLFIYLLLDYTSRDRLKDGIAITFLLILMFIIHGMTTFLSLFIFSFSIIYFYRDSIKKILIKSLPALPVLALYIEWWLYQGSISNRLSTSGILSYLPVYYKNLYFHALPDRLGLFYRDNSYLYSGSLGQLIGIGFSLFILAISLYRFRTMGKLFKEKMYSNKLIIVLIFASSSLFLCLFAPQIKGFVGHSYQRFSVFFLISIFLLGSIMAQKLLKPLKVWIMIGVCFIHLTLWANYFREFQKENRTFTETIFPKDSKNKKLGALIYERGFRGLPTYIHFPNYYIIWKDGIATTRIVDFGLVWKIGRKVNKTLLPRYNEWVDKFHDYDGRYENMDYILVRGRLSENAAKYMDKFKVVKSSGKWVLYERTT